MAVAKGTQRTYLRDRLDGINRKQGTYWGGEKIKLPVPISVIEAKKRIARDSKIVERFHHLERKANERSANRKREMASECRRAIEFEDSKKALALLDRFEKMKF